MHSHHTTPCVTAEPSTRVRDPIATANARHGTASEEPATLQTWEDEGGSVQGETTTLVAAVATRGSPPRDPPVAPVSVLLVEPESARAALIRRIIADAPGGPCRVEQVTTLASAYANLAEADADVDVVLFHRALPGGAGETHDQARLAATGVLLLAFNDMRHEDDGWLAAVLGYIARRKTTEASLRATEEALFEEKERAQVTLDSIGDAVLVTDVQGRVTYLNRIAATLTAWPGDEALGHPLETVFNIVDGLTGQVAMNPAISAMQEDEIVGLVDHCILYRRDGSGVGIEDSAAPIHDRNGRVTGAVIVFRDVSQSRAMIRKMEFLAQHDVLTGLANRALLSERLGQAIGLARRRRKQVALLFVDLDHFKKINDSLGHSIGDQVLRTIGERLSACVRLSDTVCRLGGDEFVILLAEIDRSHDAALIVDKVLATITQPLNIDGHILHVSASVGSSIHPDDSADVDGMIKHADRAMYRAKTAGGGNGHAGIAATVDGPRVRVPLESGQRCTANGVGRNGHDGE